MAADIHLSTRRPDPPEGADFALYIEFARGSGNPQRIFQAADMMIRALQRVDRALCSSVTNTIEPMMVLEEIQAGSLKIWLRNLLTAIDDEALKQIEWKPLIGKYLVRAKYAYIRWTNKSEGTSLVDLAQNLRQIAAETDVRHIPDYAPPSIQELAETTREIDAAKSLLIDGDKMSYLPPDEKPVDFDLAIRWAPEELSKLAVKETTKFDNMPMTLIVKKPDYLGSSKWDLRHGKRTIAAAIADEAWLRRFQNREIDVRPGDALKSLVTVEHHYGFDNELIDEAITVTKVEGVVPNLYRQPPLLDT